MNKSSNIIGSIIFKIVVICVVASALFLSYGEIQKYNFPIEIQTSDYKVSTNAAFIGIIAGIIIAVLFSVNSFFTGIMNKIYMFKEGYRGAQKNKSISSLIEASVLLAFSDKKGAKDNLSLVDNNYLDPKQKLYFELISSMSLNDNIPITLYGYMQNFPFIKRHISKKIARIEFKMGNLDKALVSAKEYYNYNQFDPEVNLIIAEIYAAQKDWDSMDSLIEKYISSTDNMISPSEFSNLYFQAAKDMVSTGNNSDVLYYCKKSLEITPDNLASASLFAEISLLQKNYDSINNFLISCFQKKPSFDMFLLINKFSNLDPENLYQKLSDSLDLNKYSDLFIAICVVLNLDSSMKEILELVF
jgi:uncharacterized protein HemY